MLHCTYETIVKYFACRDTLPHTFLADSQTSSAGRLIPPAGPQTLLGRTDGISLQSTRLSPILGPLLCYSETSQHQRSRAREQLTFLYLWATGLDVRFVRFVKGGDTPS